MSESSLGPCPPATHALSLADIACVKVVGVTNPDYADWQRRRAERAEELLRDAMSLHWLQDPYEEVEELRGRVAAHFDEVKP